MDSGALGFPIEMCLAPLLVLAILAAVYLLVRQLKARAQTDLGQMRSEWRRFDAARRKIGETVLAFKDDRNEPFYSRTRDLQTIMDDIDIQANLLGSRRVQLNQRANTLASVQGLALMRSFIDWYDLRRQVGDLRRDLERTNQALAAAAEKEHEIRRLGWNIAQQARQALRVQRQLHQIMERLRARNLQGDAFDAASTRSEALRQSLEEIPAYFFNAGEEALLAQVDRDAIIFTHTAVEQARPELDTLLAQAQDWERLFTRAQEAAGLLERAVDDLDTTLNTIPPGVDLAEARKGAKAMRQIVKTLQSTLAHPEVANLEDLVQEAGRQTRVAQELGQSLKRARREVAALETVLVELPAAYKDLSLQLATLGARSVHPVTWRASVDALTELTRKTNALGAANQARTPEKLQADLQTAVELRTRQKQLSESFQRISGAHGELLAVLAGPSFARWKDWLDESRRRMEKIAEYAPDNWGRSEAVETLPRDLDALAASADRLQITHPSEPLMEDQVLERLKDVRLFAEEYQRLQARVDAARTRLDELVQIEAAAREQAEAAGALLGQIDFIVDSNEFLGGIAAQDSERFGGEIQRLSADLADRKRGRIDQKARQVEALIERIETAANRWLDQLIREIRQTSDEMAGLLRELDEIAQLEEKPVVEARRLLTSGAGLPPGGEPGGRGARSAYPLDELLPELKRRSDYWHSCNAAVRALEDFHPLIETYQDVMFQRDRAHQALTTAVSDIRKRRAWPPTTVTFDAEWQEMETIDAQLEDLRNSRSRAIARTAQLGGIAARYGALAERAAQAAERATRERTDVEEIEAQINELAELWRNNLHQYSQYPDVTGEIQALLEDLHHLLGKIRRDYIQGGADFSTTLKAMKDLNKRVRYYQVAIDDDNALDVQGNVHRRRESRRV